MSIDDLLEMAHHFKHHCPQSLLGMDGKYLLDSIINDLTVLKKNPLNSNDDAQYQMLNNVQERVDKLRVLVKTHSTPLHGEQGVSNG